MKRQDFDLILDAGVGPAAEEGSPATILAVGDLDEWTRHRGSLPVDGSLAFASFNGISIELLEIISPAIVLSPLLARGFDCIDLAQMLVSVGFRGQYRAIAENLPNPDIIRREIRILCPTLDFDVVLVSGEGARIN